MGNPLNVAFMRQTGTIVSLEASPERIVERLQQAPADQRPLVRGKSGAQLLDYVRTKLAERAEAYAQADATFNTEHLDSPAEVDAAVKAFIKRFLPDAT